MFKIECNWGQIKFLEIQFIKCFLSKFLEYICLQGFQNMVLSLLVNFNNRCQLGKSLIVLDRDILLFFHF